MFCNRYTCFQVLDCFAIVLDVYVASVSAVYDLCCKYLFGCCKNRSGVAYVTMKLSCCSSRFAIVGCVVSWICLGSGGLERGEGWSAGCEAKGMVAGAVPFECALEIEWCKQSPQEACSGHGWSRRCKQQACRRHGRSSDGHVGHAINSDHSVDILSTDSVDLVLAHALELKPPTWIIAITLTDAAVQPRALRLRATRIIISRVLD